MLSILKKVTFLLILVSLPIYGEKIIFNSGRVVYGQIVRQNRKVIFLRIRNSTVIIPKQKINRIYHSAFLSKKVMKEKNILEHKKQEVRKIRVEKKRNKLALLKKKEQEREIAALLVKKREILEKEKTRLKLQKKRKALAKHKKKELARLKKIEEEAKRKNLTTEAQIEKQYNKFEVLVSKNGTKYRGAVIGTSENTIVIHTKNGVKSIRRNSVSHQLMDVARNDLKKQKKTETVRQKTTPDKKKKEKIAPSSNVAAMLAEKKNKRAKERKIKNSERKIITKKIIKKPENVKKEEVREPLISPLRALLYSALLPGLGQWKSGRKGEGFIFGSLTFYGLFALYNANRMVVSARKDYAAMNNPYTDDAMVLAAVGITTNLPPASIIDPVDAWFYNQSFETSRLDLDKRYAKFRTAGYLTAAVYLINLAEAYFFHPERSNKKSLTENFSSKKSGPQIIYSLNLESAERYSTTGYNFRLGWEMRF